MFYVFVCARVCVQRMSASRRVHVCIVVGRFWVYGRIYIQVQTREAEMWANPPNKSDMVCGSGRLCCKWCMDQPYHAIWLSGQIEAYLIPSLIMRYCCLLKNATEATIIHKTYHLVHIPFILSLLQYLDGHPPTLLKAHF